MKLIISGIIRNENSRQSLPQTEQRKGEIYLIGVSEYEPGWENVLDRVTAQSSDHY